MPCLFPVLALKYPGGGSPQILRNDFRNEMITKYGSHDALVPLFRGCISAYDLPCGGCLQCRLSQSRNWAIRCQHELTMHPQGGIFLTLTYAPEHLPANRSLDKTVVPQFIANLRKHISTPIKYYHCGEYGDKLSRPHYHCLIFGWRPEDDQVRRIRRGLYPLYTSPLIENLWGKGHCPFGELTFESAAYTARYATKKILGKKAVSHYTRVDPDTGEIFELQPEYATMSNRGGIGRSWLEKYFNEVYPSDAVLINGHLVQPPRFYDKILQQRDPVLFEQVKKKRLQKYQENPILTVDQLAELRRATQSRFNILMRNIE